MYPARPCTHCHATEVKTVAIGIADTGRTDIDQTKLEVGQDAGLEGTSSSHAGSTRVDHADDGSAARDTDPARIDIGPMDPDQAAGTGPADGPGSD